MNPRHIPNIITVARIALVFPVIALLLRREFHWALALFIVAGVSDGLDGFLAKHYHWESRLGSYLDPLADKLLLISCFVAGAWLGLIPNWLTIAVVLRDLVIVAGAVAYYFLLHPFDGRPHWTSKLNTFMQLLLVFTVLVHHGIATLPPVLLDFAFILVLLTTISSGVVYVYVWGTSYWRESQAANPE